MMRRLVLLAGAATAQLGAFVDNACVYLRDGVAYRSGHELENAVFGDNATKFWPRLSRSPAYDASLRPQAWLEGRLDAGPDVVSYNFQLRYFELREKENALTIVGYEHWSWTDRRLNYTLGPGCGPTTEGWVLSAGFIPKLWQPDPYTVNDLRNARPFSPRDTVFISPGGTVTIAYLSTKHLQCDMKFQDLPDDDQKCSNPVGSYLYNADLVRMAGPTIDYTNAATASGDVFSNQWRIVDASVAVYSTSYDGVPYSELHQRARFSRKHKYYVSEAMFPALFFLVISYCGFWLDRTVAPARVAIAVIPVLIMRTLVNGAFANIQIISYNTFLTASLHLGEAMCIIAVFEYAFVQYLLAREKRARAAHGRYAASRAPIAACLRDPARDAPLAVRAAAARLRGLVEGFAGDDGLLDAAGLRRVARSLGRAPSVGEIAAMVDMARRGATTLDVAGAVDFVLAYDEVCCAGVAAGRGVVDMPPSEQLDVAFRFAFPVVGVLLLLTQVIAHRDEGPAGALFEDSSFNDPLFFSWTPFFAVAFAGCAEYARRLSRARGAPEAPEDDPKAPTAVAPEGWGSTVGDIVDAGEDPATPI